MAKNSIRDYSNVNSSNTDIQSIDIAEGCSPAGINNAIREVMADLKDVSTGAVALESPAADSLTVTGDLTVDTDRLIVDSTNNRVGIGTTSADAGLNIKQTADDAYQLKLEQYNATDGYGIICDMTDGDLAFARYASSAYSERMRITAAGNVGIGTSSPSGGVQLDVRGSGVIQLVNTDTVQLLASGGGSTLKNVSNNPLLFGTNNTERMRIDSSGNLLVGYTSSNGAYKLQVNSQIFATSATIATSDGNYKENVTPLDGVLSLVSQLNPVQFDWKEHPVHKFDRNQPTIGFIAQEVQQVLAEQPYLNSIVKSNECVLEPEETDDEGNVIKEAVTEPFLGIAEGNMVALLTAAIKEQQATITELEARITALENA